MGQTPWFVFSFIVAQREGDSVEPVPPVQVPTQRPPVSTLTWLWRRVWDDGAGPRHGLDRRSPQFFSEAPSTTTGYE
jgi:hypothetical protein